jgi:hypothetical protein
VRYALHGEGVLWGNSVKAGEPMKRTKRKKPEASEHEIQRQITDYTLKGVFRYRNNTGAMKVAKSFLLGKGIPTPLPDICANPKCGHDRGTHRYDGECLAAGNRMGNYCSCHSFKPYKTEGK